MPSPSLEIRFFWRRWQILLLSWKVLSVQLPQEGELQWDRQPGLPCGILLAGGSALGRLRERCCPTAVPAVGADVCRGREGVLIPPARASLYRGGSHPPGLVSAVPSQALFWVRSENQRSLKELSHICLISLGCYLWIFFTIKSIIQYNFLLLSFWVFLNTTSPQICNPRWFSQSRGVHSWSMVLSTL